MIDIGRLAETEYRAVADPLLTKETAFGRFTHDPRFPQRHDANQFLDVRCSAHEVEDMLELLETLYEPLGFAFRKLSAHDPATVQHLMPTLQVRAWSVKATWMMLFRCEPKRPINPDVKIKVVDSQTSQDLKQVYGADFRPFMHRSRTSQDSRLGGETIVAYLADKPVGTTGWFVVEGVVRYRGVFVHPEYRKRDIASSMIQYVQKRPLVQAQEALTIFVADDGPVRLYEALGFEKQGKQWEAFKTVLLA